MINSVGSAGASGLLIAVMKEAAAAQDVDIAVLKKSQDVENANGEAALKLIASTAGVTSADGIDFHV